MRARQAVRGWAVALALLSGLPCVPASAADYPFPAPGVQCRRDLAWLGVTLPAVLPAREARGGQDAHADTHTDAGADAGDLFMPAPAAPLLPALQVWQQLVRARYCGLARTLRHRVA